MSRTLRQSSLIWLMIACQCMVVLLGPRAIWICREDDGTSHTELISSTCCDSNDRLPPPDAAGFCSAGDCLDEPIDHAPAVRPARPASVTSPRHALGHHCVLWSCAASRSAIDSVRSLQVTLAAHGPPGPSRLSLRATIL